MTLGNSRSIVVLGLMTKMPVPGVIWQTLHYLLGLRRIGYDVTYAEAHARTPSMFVGREPDAGTRQAASFLQRVLTPFGLGDSWAFHALHHDGACLGPEASVLSRRYREAELILNLCGGTRPRPEHVEGGRLLLIATDPVQIEIELWQGRRETRSFLDAHLAWCSFGERYDQPGCSLPISEGYRPIPTRQPVILDLWDHDLPDSGAYTTVANWHQSYRKLTYRGETYWWSKDREFRKFLALPRLSRRRFHLALASYKPEDRAILESRGWTVEDADGFGFGTDPYRPFIQTSRGEFTVAKDQNVRLKSGWFSDRSATYLAAGRPVVTQDTGFSGILPTGRGLFAVENVEEAAEAVRRIEADYSRARDGALEVARSSFDYRLVLPRLLGEVGVEGPSRRFPAPAVPGGGETTEDHDTRKRSFPDELELRPLGRRPLRLAGRTVRAILDRPLPRWQPPSTPAAWVPKHGATASIIVVTWGKLPFTRLCLETVLLHTRHPAYEIIVVDNASEDGTPDYLRGLAGLHPQLRLILNPTNEGFAAACNQGARIARGDVLVFLNNDTIVPRAWLLGLVEPLGDPGLGAVNPVTNRVGTEADIGLEGMGSGPSDSLGSFLRRAESRSATRSGELRAVQMLAFFCLALRKEVWEAVGELDEGFGTGLFEDDDYSLRLLRAGFRLGCVEGVFVHHFGEASFGDLVPDGRYARLFGRNRSRFEEKWGGAWSRHTSGPKPEYEELLDRVRTLAGDRLGEGATVAVISRGDDRLLELGNATGWHFPRLEDGSFAGHYPADGREAVGLLQETRRQGADYLLIPRPGFWWLEHYLELRRHLEETGNLVLDTEDLLLYRLRRGGVEGSGTDARERFSERGVRP